MNNGNGEFRGMALVDPVSLVPQVIYGPAGYWVVYLPLETPPNTIVVMPGNTVRFNAQFQHRGAASSYALYCSMGKNIAGIFNEDSLLTKSFSQSVAAHDDWTTITVYGDVPIPSSYDGFGWKDAYAKIMVGGSDKVISPVYTSCVQVVAAIPYFQNMAITSFAKV
jgi:hypothetical protein